MEKWLTRLGRAGLMGLAWAVVWVPIGMIGGRIVVGELEPEHIGGPLYAGFLSGSIFAALAGFASGRRRFDQTSMARAAAWGALSGLLVGALPFVIGDQHQPGDRPLWVLPVVAMGSLMVIGAFTAAVSLPLARVMWKNYGEASRA